MIASLAIRTGISPLDLLDCPPTIIDEMVRLLLEQQKEGAK